MKTRLLIIIVIILLAVSITYVSFAYNQEIKLATGMMEREDPPHWFTGEEYCQEWCDNDKLYQAGCNQLILSYLYRYSNLLDDEFDGIVYLEWMGLPDGVSVEKFDECFDYILETRIKELKNEN